MKLLGGKGLKVPVTLAVSFVIAQQVPVDLIALLYNGEASLLGDILTDGLLRGGSKRIAETFGDLKRAAEELK